MNNIFNYLADNLNSNDEVSHIKIYIFITNVIQ